MLSLEAATFSGSLEFELASGRVNRQLQASSKCGTVKGLCLGMGKPADLLQGTLDLLVLKTISREPSHGWAIAKRIEQESGEVLQVRQGSLYPALYRLEHWGWIRGEWRATELARKGKCYSLTRAGRAQLDREVLKWDRLSQAVNAVVKNGLGRADV